VRVRRPGALGPAGAAPVARSLVAALTLLAAGVTSGASAASVAAGAPVIEPRVVAVHPHDPEAFTQGLVLDGDLLYESTGLRGRSSVRRVDLASGRVLARRALPGDLFGEGLAVMGPRLYQLTWRAGLGFVRDRDTLAVLETFTYPGEGWGLARHGALLVMSDGTDVLRLVEPRRFAVTGTLAVHDAGEAVAWLNELEVVGRVVYANVWRTTRVARIDLDSGAVIDWIELASLIPEHASGKRVGVANGIAHDRSTGRLVVTGKLWPVLYEIEVPPPAR